MGRRARWVAVWLLGVAGLWWALPPAPRLTWHVPAGAWVVGLSADGLVVVAHGNPPFLAHMSPSGSPDEGVARGPVEAWDIPSGRRLWTYGGPDDRLHVGYGPAAGVVFVRRLGPPPADLRFDHRTGAERPADDRPLFDGQPADHYAPGGTVAFVNHCDPEDSGLRTTTAYTNTGRRLYIVPLRRIVQYMFSPDGRVVAELRYFPDQPDRPSELVVREVLTGRELSRVEDAGWATWPTAVTSDGRRVIGADNQLIDTATGQVVPYEGFGDGHFLGSMLTADSRWVVMATNTSLPGTEGEQWQVDWFDPVTGRPDPARRRVVARGENWSVYTHASGLSSHANGQVGRWLGVQAYHEPRPSFTYEWLHRQAPGMFPLGRDGVGQPIHLRGFNRVMDSDTGRVLVDLPVEHRIRGVMDDGRAVVTEFYGERPGVAVWGVPPRPSLRLFAALAAGWALVLFVLARRWRRGRVGVFRSPRGGGN